MVNKNHELFCWSWSVKEGNTAEDRERFTMDFESETQSEQEGAVKSRAKFIMAQNPEARYFFLQTCHRVELYGWGVDPLVAFQYFWPFSKPSQTQVKKIEGDQAFRHLLRVVSSLESEVLGETQITSQIKDALDKNIRIGWLRFPLNRIIETALASSKKIRRETGIGEGTVSVAHASIEGLSDTFDTLKNKKVMVVGAGSMAIQAIEKFLDRGVREINWLNRTRERIQNHPLAQKLEVRIQNFDDRYFLLPFHDVVFVATGAPQFVFEKNKFLNSPLCPLERFLEKTVNDYENQILTRPLKASKSAANLTILLDLGLPRNVDPEIHGLLNTYVRNVDEFRSYTDASKNERIQKALESSPVIDSEVSEFKKISAFWRFNKEIGEIFKGVEIVKQFEINKQVGLEKNEKIEYIVQSIYAKLMHRLKNEIENLIENSDETLAQSIMDILSKAWRHPEQWLQKNQSTQRQPEPKNPSPSPPL
jgi:glutamyl-tRNA reductase